MRVAGYDALKLYSTPPATFRHCATALRCNLVDRVCRVYKYLAAVAYRSDARVVLLETGAPAPEALGP